MLLHSPSTLGKHARFGQDPGEGRPLPIRWKKGGEEGKEYNVNAEKEERKANSCV